ncbi:hypothetical protein D3C81_1911900 [compost metagenome]
MKDVVVGFTTNAPGPLQKPFRCPGGVLTMGLRHMLFTGTVAVVTVAGMCRHFLPLIEQSDQFARDPGFQL